jgi:hypothetical protein
VHICEVLHILVAVCVIQFSNQLRQPVLPAGTTVTGATAIGPTAAGATAQGQGQQQQQQEQQLWAVPVVIEAYEHTGSW